MSFLFDKKTEHENQCEAAIRAGDTKQAIFHAAKAAEFDLALAEQTAGGIADHYLENANGWLDIADRLKTSPLPKRASSAAAAPGSGTPVTEAPAGAEDSEFQISEIPNVSMNDICGMEEAKLAIQEMIVLPMKAPEKAKALNLRPGGGVLLYGPPGNGKTMLGKAIAHEIQAAFFYASGAQIRSKWHGESEQKLSRLIQDAQKPPVAVLFLDEVDGLLPRRTGGSSVVDNRLVTQFLADIGGFRESKNTLLLLGATNKPWEIDEAVFRTGRFDEKLYIGIPDLPARLGMLERNLKGVSLQDGFDYNKWADRLAGYTGSDIVGIIHSAKRSALARNINEPDLPKILEGDFEQAFKSIPSSVTSKMLQQYKAFGEQRFN